MNATLEDNINAVVKDAIGGKGDVPPHYDIILSKNQWRFIYL